MKKLTPLTFICLLVAHQSVAGSTSQIQMRASAMCGSYADRARIASPDVVYNICLTGFRDSSATCNKKQKQFSEQASNLNGMNRAEYMEIAQAYRIGCNAGKQTR
ncbi:hypothetical protein [Citrobacter portucalensis]|uniref:hypothetical protein n=1 Tax=Citrobacter portucalensis TaxID=1639133 RepID=UPI00403470FF